MNQDKMIDDLIKMLDGGMTKGVGHVNVEVDQDASQAKSVQTMGCADCSSNPMACSIPTLHEGIDDSE
ncbi:MAG: hypothetical protein IJZ84_04085 [Lachnospiraceae bacterium]|nr:hypothetical protein [Lachnospiraceae bacterium]